jgi:aspartate kinase
MESLCVMKFGGTSVGNADCIRRVAAIVQSATTQARVVVVVSAMSGVTNQLIEAAHRAETGERDFLPGLIADLRAKHAVALEALVSDAHNHARIAGLIAEVLGELADLLQGTALLCELTPRVLDAISGSGERLSAPLVAGALCEAGLRSVVVPATEVIVTDGHHGRAEPLMVETRERAEA